MRFDDKLAIQILTLDDSDGENVGSAPKLRGRPPTSRGLDPNTRQWLAKRSDIGIRDLKISKVGDRTPKREKRAPRESQLKSHRRYRLKKYGLTEQAFDAMLEAQGHKCLLCDTAISRAVQVGPRYGGRPGFRYLATSTTVAIDHCHATNKVRGLLCMLCNRGLGDFKDDADRLRRAADYLDKHR